MLSLRHLISVTVICLWLALPALAADISGRWEANFDTAIGPMHYIYTFKVDGDKLTGTAKTDQGETTIGGGTIKGDAVAFTEAFNGLTITYQGKLVDNDTIAFTRQVGDIATEQLTAKRVK